MKTPKTAKNIQIEGIVQGVGYRPFIFQLAQTHHLSGQVSNTATGVEIHIEGNGTNVKGFVRDLKTKAPPLAHVLEVHVQPASVEGLTEFCISKSQTADEIHTLISPDIATCGDCANELFNPADRRFQYPFINCTNCGPRYTIIDALPYDRPFTTMHPFTMCNACQTEYEQPSDRRFHAQPNACPDCGPAVILYDRNQKPVLTNDPIKTAAALIKKGNILSIKGLGGFHLCVDAENDAAVQLLRQKKSREEKPLAVMAFGLDQITRFAHVSSGEKKLLLSHQRPIVLLKKRTPNVLSPGIAPNNNYLGVMLPYTPLHLLLLENDFTALVMTSANRKDEPIVIGNADAFNRLGDIADYFLLHNRDIRTRCDDSIVRHLGGESRYIRRSRGYAPLPLLLKKKVPMILACGAELKNTICLTKNTYAFLSQHIGDLKYADSYAFYVDTIDRMKRLFDITPECIAHDRHPDYLSSQYASEQKEIPKIAVQHHHAHLAACLAENDVDDDVIGIVCDGTGLGDDGHIWGGEILIADPKQYTRVAHFDYIPMPGGDAASKQPWRMGLSYLYHVFGSDMLSLDLPFLKNLKDTQKNTIIQMIEKRINTPLTSSLGRLFDGVAAIIGLRSEVSYESQAAVDLEMLAAMDAGSPQKKDVYDFSWKRNHADQYTIHTEPLITSIVDSILTGIHPGIISTRFHTTLIFLFADLIRTIAKDSGIKRVALSGGVFQNAIFFKGLQQCLRQRGYDVITHRQVPTNDGGIALGQAVIANAQLS